MAKNPYEAAATYRDHAITTASPARVVVLVFERLTLDLERALAAIESGIHPTPTSFMRRNYSWPSFPVWIPMHGSMPTIMRQKEHHAKRSFKDEYTSLLNKFEVEYDEKYLFDWIDDSDSVD